MNDLVFLEQLILYVQETEEALDAEYGNNRAFLLLLVENPHSIPDVYYEAVRRLAELRSESQ